MRGRLAGAVALAAALAGLHLATRLHADRARPLAERAFYAADYDVALALLAGKGFVGLDLAGDTRPEAAAVRRFLMLDAPEVSAAELDRFARGASTGAPTLLASTRVLEIRWAALLWRTFGVRWSTLFASYAVLSSLVCVLVFLLASRLGGGLAPGVFAALIFVASPLENEGLASALRDINPLWFDAIGFWALIVWFDPGARSRVLGLASLLLGGVATLGIGWRTDGFLLPPVLLAGLLLRLLEARRRPRALALSAVLFLAGTLLAGRAIASLGPAKQLTPQIGFHIAYYGGADRANLLGIENSFQTVRDDGFTRLHANYANGRLVEYNSPAYGEACRRLYLASLRYGAFRWLSGFPGFIQQALTGFASEGTLQGRRLDELARHRVPGLAPLYAALDPLTRTAPYLFWLGAVALLLSRRQPITSQLLTGFAFLYSAVLLAVLPEAKHAGPLLLPLSVLGGIGLARVLELAWPGRRRAWLGDWSGAGRGRGLLAGLLAVVTASAVALVLTREMSKRERAGYLDEIRSLPALPPADHERRGERAFAVAVGAGAALDPVGYRLEIEAGARPGPLVARYCRGIPGDPEWGCSVNRHRLRPLARQTFFLTCLQGMSFGDRRTAACDLALAGEARIAAVSRVDLASWRRPLFSTLLQRDDLEPGAPVIGRLVSTEYLVLAAPDLGALGLQVGPGE